MSLRDNIVKVAGTATAIGALITVYQAVDTRFVHAEDFKSQVFQIKDSINDLRRARLEDEIFKLELIPEKRRTEADKAMLERYRNQIKEIDSKRSRQ